MLALVWWHENTRFLVLPLLLLLDLCACPSECHLLLLLLDLQAGRHTSATQVTLLQLDADMT
jgi:hypothetical protein